MSNMSSADERAPLSDAAITAMIAFSQVVAEFPELLPPDVRQLAIQIDRDWSPRLGEDDQSVADAVVRQVRASLGAAQEPPVDCIGLALDLESRAKTVTSQTTERAMIAAAQGLRILALSQPSQQGQGDA